VQVAHRTDIVDILSADRTQLCKDYIFIHYRIPLCPFRSKRVYFASVSQESFLGKNSPSLAHKNLNTYQSEELAVSDYLLKIFRISIPHMPKTAVKFGQELQLVLQPMIVKPSHIGGVVVSCLVIGADHLPNRIIEFARKCSLHVRSSAVSHARF
jgi:cohesin loading factor subunit SCC2